MDKTDQIEIDPLGNWKRTHDCASLSAKEIGQEVILMGWVNSRRDLGSLIFVDLRDREGMTQIVFDPQFNESVHNKAHILRSEWVIALKGEVSARLEGQENPDLATGAIEVKATGLKLLNRTETPPFQVDGKVDASETLRLKYRYLELRRKNVFEKLLVRHNISSNIREYLNRNDFIEVETPFLTKSTPEGARDYLVPSRVNKGMFFALPQSPQLFKQLLMVAGFDRYYQIVRCFRDEDLRADRQPEFTQVDLEMSFVDENGVMEVFEGMMSELFEEILGVKIPTPIPRILYQDAIERFGTDRPDTRFGMELRDITDLVQGSNFRVLNDILESGGVVKGINVENKASDFSRKAIDDLTRLVSEWRAKGLLWIKVTDDGWQSPIKKYFSDESKKKINERFNAHPGDLILIIADEAGITAHALGMLRLEMARRCDLIKDGDYSFLWVTQFPLLEWDDEEGRFMAVHHPFTSPMEEDFPILGDNPEKVRARAYDLILNGVEIGGGSIRIHNLSMQEKMFNILGISREEAEMKFGFLLEALKYGAPPHGGMALGFDRLVAIMTGVESIREVIAFPKTASASCLMTNAPSKVDQHQLGELGLKLD